MFRPLTTALVAASLALSACTRLEDAVIDHKVAQMAAPPALMDPDTIRITLCGTGTPEQRDRSRAQACTLASVGGKLFLFDAGEGATTSLESMQIPVSQITSVFITHWHSDHFNGLGPLLNYGWIWGRHQPVDLYGPPGVEAVLQGLSQAYAIDQGFRSAHVHAGTHAALGVAHPVVIPPGQHTVRVYAQDGITIDAQRVSHLPVEPAYGYVIQYRGKKVFISGDTKVDPVYLPALQNADLVVHEAVKADLVHRGAQAMRRHGLESRAQMAEQITDYHADTLALARMAQEAQVKHLVLTHLIPSPSDFLTRKMFVQGMSSLYRGEITMGQDGMVFEVPTNAP